MIDNGVTLIFIIAVAFAVGVFIGIRIGWVLKDGEDVSCGD